jgi:hypothetical protein
VNINVQFPSLLGEAALCGELVDAEDLPQEPAVGTLLPSFGAGYIAPDEGPSVRQMVAQLCEINLYSEFSRALQNVRVNSFGLCAFPRDIRVLST